MTRELVPTLRAGDLVVMDNLACHKNPSVLRAIRAAGAHVLFLPPYSPDLNPIEQAFAKIKHQLRNAAARSRETLWRAVGEVLEDIEPQECANYLRNAGYVSKLARTRSSSECARVLSKTVTVATSECRAAR